MEESQNEIFRPFNIQGRNDITDWQETNEYNTTAIGQIVDPDNATIHKEVTSIPSPLARLDLVKNAFFEVVDPINRQNITSTEKRKEALDQVTNHHKLVSEALDVAELFFNHNRLKDKFKIIIWDRNRDCDKDNELGNALDLFLTADSQSGDPYNLGSLKRIYLLSYVGPERPYPINIVGGTSPATLFFSAPGDLAYVARNVVLGDDRPFDDLFCPLYRRDFEFQKYLFLFSKSIVAFASRFPEFNDYLRLNYQCLNDQQKKEIDELTPDDMEKYAPITCSDEGSDMVEILGQEFRQRARSGKIGESDFAIKTTKTIPSPLPLVLPVSSGSRYANYRYTTGLWGTENKAPYYDEKSWKQRTMPVVGDEYPYLTISDFLEDYIIRMPFKMDSVHYFSAGYLCRDEGAADSYLLPLRSDFFTFFGPGDLDKLMKIQAITNGVKVTLQIPVKRGFIEYNRTYFFGGAPNREENDGAVADINLGMGIMPFIKFPPKVRRPSYTIAFFDNNSQSDTALTFEQCTLQSGRKVLSSVSHSYRLKKDIGIASHETYVVEDNFDLIKVTAGDISNYIVPQFKPCEGSSRFTFAVDFGTTNTHIEYKKDQNTSRPFGFDAKHAQMVRLHSDYRARPDINRGFEQDFIPNTIGTPDDPFSFPMRTVIALRDSLNPDAAFMAYTDANIPFLYEKDFIPRWNKIQSNLKWDAESDKVVTLYIETLFTMLRDKVLADGGELSQTRIVWFYPASMTESKIYHFNDIWTNAYSRYFSYSEERQEDGASGNGDDNKIIMVSESTAPHRYFSSEQATSVDVVSIDIGGGTTDVLVVEDSKDKILMSFRYASNSIFGDAFNSNPTLNGFVSKYSPAFRSVMQSNGMTELEAALSQIEERGHSEDITAFLFSLAGSRGKENSGLDFLKQLSKDDRMRYVFVIFYASLFYYIAKVMKTKGMRHPSSLTLSGNGARSIQVLSSNKEILGRFAKLIFGSVYGEEELSMSIHILSNPKTATCKGGLKFSESQPPQKIEALKYVNVGVDLDNPEGKMTYGEITDEVVTGVIQSVKTFLSSLFRNEKFIVDTLGAERTIFKDVRDYCTGREGEQAMYTSIKQGISRKRERQEVTSESELEETLFFYPLIGLLNNVAYKFRK